MTDSEQLLEELRPVAFAIAYRMLGTVSDAEEVVQDALLRVHQRLAINELHSARARRERYFGEWLPEPIVTDGDDQPAQRAELADSLSVAMLVLLERLSPEQRDELAGRFFAAAEQGDLAGLEALLAHDVELTGDGGGKVPALARSLHGRSRVARTLAQWSRLSARVPGTTWRRAEVNGGPGALVFDAEQRVVSVIAIEVADGQVTAVRSVVNPEKLAHLGPVGNLGSFLRSAR